MRYSKEKARQRKEKILEIETSLKLYQEKCATDPSAENFEQLDILKSKYDAHFDYLAKRAIISDLKRLGIRRAKKIPSTP